MHSLKLFKSLRAILREPVLRVCVTQRPRVNTFGHSVVTGSERWPCENRAKDGSQSPILAAETVGE